MTMFMVFSLFDSGDLLIPADIFRLTLAQQRRSSVVHPNKTPCSDDCQSTLYRFFSIKTAVTRVNQSQHLADVTLYSHYLFKVFAGPCCRTCASMMKAAVLCC
ncbi:hypothetical protein ACIPL1_31600 [Pseudomonas sp. NPDC090202]|uniref:hypothetical protein n=1 Tax=unclassified Pseudomonas TaxID=196821 RepID=UPI0037FCF45E